MQPLSVLSPSAQPYVPPVDTIKNGRYILNAAIDYNVMESIPDEALDVVFPPTAEEAAEINAVNDFVELMVNLSFLEENEEYTRLELSQLKLG